MVEIWCVLGADPSCEHAAALVAVEPRTPDGCEECLETGSAWVGLRLCRTCGYVGCCGDSPQRHAERHYRAVDHPVVTAYRSADVWGWCYEDEALIVPEAQS